MHSLIQLVLACKKNNFNHSQENKMQCIKDNNFIAIQSMKIVKSSKAVLSALIIGVSLSLAGCGGSSTEVEEAPKVDLLAEEMGQIMIVVRDDEEDFLSYDIDILSIDLVRVDGSQVSVTPTTARVDFIQYTELSELFSINTIPTGRYNQISFTLDYSTASIVIQDESGISYQASAQNSEGETLTTYALTLVLDDGEPLMISKGKLSAITLDLDLASTNQIISFEPAIVQVDPFVNVTVGAEEAREHRARGLLQSVDSASNTLTIAVKPLRKQTGDFGEMTITVDESTLYEIDGVEIPHGDAFATLASLPIDSPIIAFGWVDAESVFSATKVIAGSSVAWAGQDAFRGVITARTAESITISGVVFSHEDREATHTEELTFLYNDLTKITGFNQQEISANSLSIGQHIKALGEFEAQQTFNSADSIVHIKLSTIIGQVVQNSPLIIDVSKFNRKPVESYDFTGTGLTSEQDADPDNYQINSANLNVDSLISEDWLTIKGYVSDFGQAPDDFNASSLLKKNLSHGTTSFKVHWSEGTASFTIDSETNQINWDSTGAEQRMRIHGIPHDITADYIVQAINSDEEEGRYAIKEKDVSIKYFSTYTDFVSALSAALTEGKIVKQLTSKGDYDEEMQGIKAVAVSMVLQ